jgi:glycosyltransferase involved in cell wall biosynthesis
MAAHIVIDARRVRDFGIGTYIRSLVQALGAIDRTNQYTLVSGPADVRALEGLPENFRSAVYTRSDHSSLDHLAFPIFLKGLSPDLVHIPLNRIPLLMIKPYVVTIHDLANIFFEQDASSLRMQLRRYRFRRGLVRANRVIAVSEATKRDVEAQMGVPSSRITRVYNAPDPAFFNRAAEPGGQEQQLILERYQINYPFLLYAGNIRRHKNIPRLVEAFAVVRDQLARHPVYKDLRLVIIGDTISQYPAVRQAVIKSRVENVVRFLGFVPFETLRCFYESAAGFVFPSRYEGFGLPPLEAMACGTPVVTSNVSSLPEVVGDAAIQVNPENVFDIARGISDMLLDEELRARLIRRGREQASRFSWNWTARQVLEIYKDVIGQS